MLLEDYQACLVLRNYQPATLQKNVQLAKRFFKHVGEAENINSLCIEQYLKDLHQQGRSIKTIKNHLTAIKVFCDFLHRHRHIKENPANYITPLRMPEEVPVCLTEGEIRKVYEIGDEFDMLCEVTLALNIGMRMSEMRRLQWRDIDLDNRQLIVKKSKSKRPRTIPINQKVMIQLRRQYERFYDLVFVFPSGRGGPGHRSKWTLPKMRGVNWWSKKSIKQLQPHIPSIAELPEGSTGRGWHALRHTFATRAIKAGIDLITVRDWMGHRKIDTTMRYIHVARHYDKRIELL